MAGADGPAQSRRFRCRARRGNKAYAGRVDMRAEAFDKMAAGPVRKLGRGGRRGMRVRQVQNNLLLLQRSGREHRVAQFALIGARAPPAQIKRQQITARPVRENDTARKQRLVHALGNIMFGAAPEARINARRWRNRLACNADASGELAVTQRVPCHVDLLLEHAYASSANSARLLPITHRTIGMKHALQNLLLKRVLCDGALVDFDAKPRARAGTHGAAQLIERMRVSHNFVTPFDVLAYRLADDEIRLCEAKLKSGSRADGPLRVVRRERDTVRFGERADLARRCQSAAVRDIRLRDFAAAGG